VDIERSVILWLIRNRDEDPLTYLEHIIGQQSWKDRAACKDAPTAIFFPRRGESTPPAKAYCQRCEVRSDSLSFALSGDAHNDTGVWGGTSARERRKATEAGASQLADAV